MAVVRRGDDGGAITLADGGDGGDLVAIARVLHAGEINVVVVSARSGMQIVIPQFRIRLGMR